ncbi:FGGY-family carbohydrate kinase [Rubellimicrobium thermophilum]|uniref:FGGY-family carbohydrate kinase n=1 Tax=Rubellimicrobium thermophilum TaxID=295419 RepID=UPI001FDEEBD9|nr:FGGY-family carbohydrate kinase [Rubellimicrobium thermophilum]
MAARPAGPPSRPRRRLCPSACRGRGLSPGARGLVCLPYFSGERTPLHDPHARGVLFGLDLTHGRGDIYHAALEGIAAATRHIVETYREAGSPPTRVMAVGAGPAGSGSRPHRT